MGEKCVCVGCSHFSWGRGISAINNVSFYKDARQKSAKASSKKTKKRSDEATSNARGTFASVDHSYPIYLQRNTNNANIFYEAPSCFYHSPNINVLVNRSRSMYVLEGKLLLKSLAPIKTSKYEQTISSKWVFKHRNCCKSLKYTQ